MIDDDVWGDFEQSAATTTSPRLPRLAGSVTRWADITAPMLDKLDADGANTAGLAGLPTGFPEIDEMLHGLQPGRLYLVAALTGAGKSVWLGDVFRAWMTLAVPSCMVTLEMGREEVWQRQAAAACEIDHDRLQTGALDDRDWSKLARWVGDTNEAPAYVCDPPAATVDDLAALVRHGVEAFGWRAVIVDYAQKILAPSRVSREQAVASIAVGLKTIAREAGIPVVVGAQLNRESSKRPGGEPRLSDLRESAALEHEADVGILIHRPDYDDPKHPRAGEADLRVAKNRSGRKGTVTVAAQMQWQRFRSFGAEELSACVSCYRQHPGEAGSKCPACVKPSRTKP